MNLHRLTTLVGADFRQQLIDAARAGDQAAIEDLVREVHRPLSHTFRRRFRDDGVVAIARRLMERMPGIRPNAIADMLALAGTKFDSGGTVGHFPGLTDAEVEQFNAAFAALHRHAPKDARSGVRLSKSTVKLIVANALDSQKYRVDPDHQPAGPFVATKKGSATMTTADQMIPLEEFLASALPAEIVEAEANVAALRVRHEELYQSGRVVLQAASAEGRWPIDLDADVPVDIAAAVAAHGDFMSTDAEVSTAFRELQSLRRAFADTFHQAAAPFMGDAESAGTVHTFAVQHGLAR